MPRRNATGCKKIVIRQYAKPPQLPPNYYETTSQAILDNSLSLLEDGGNTGSFRNAATHQAFFSLQAAYTAVTQLVRHGKGPRLYGDVVTTLDMAAQRTLVSLQQQNHYCTSAGSRDSQQHRAESLARMATQYKAYSDYLLIMKHICLQLDSQLLWDPVSKTASNSTTAFGRNGYTLWRVGLLVFAKRLEPIQLDIYQNWLTEFLADWNGNDAKVDRSILQAVWYMWHDLPNVLDETKLQNDLEAYWSNHPQHPSNNTNNTSARMAYVYEIFQRCHRYEPWLPVAWLQHIVDTQLYQPQAIQLSDDLCIVLLSEGIESIAKTSDEQAEGNILYQWWTLHTRYNAVDAAQRLQNYAKKAAANRGIADLLQFQNHFSTVLQKLPGAVAAVPTKAVYEAVVTEEMAETLAKYMDGILRSTKKLDLQTKDWINKVIVGVFVPLPSKDVFEAFYKKDLAKRLLWNRVVSMDVEKQVCSFLKAECGTGYTSKIEGMFQDIENSRETMIVYQQQLHQQELNNNNNTNSSCSSSSNPENAFLSTSFDVQVLTTGYWPIYPEYPNLILPQFLQDHQNRFSEFYKSKYQGRRMAWKYALGHCVIKTHGFAKPYELVMSLCQAIVLIQFNNDGSDHRTLPELIKLTGLEDRDEMERILQSLSLGKDGTRILRKMDHVVVGGGDGGGTGGSLAKPRKVVCDQDTFCINESFSNKALRIRVTNILTKETKQERDTTVAAVCRDRLYLIDAAIVRILKSRKSLLHQALIPQVLEHLKFPAKVADIKKRIESLIEREYVERDAQDRNRYNYLA